MEKNQKKQAKQAGWFMEMLVLTAAVAVISAAVYFFLIPSHASVSSISGLAIVLSNFCSLIHISHHNDFKCDTFGDWFLYLRKDLLVSRRSTQAFFCPYS